MLKEIDISGNKYGRLTVIEKTNLKSGYYPLWKCLCDCGNYKLASVYNLNKGLTRSCGCYQKEMASKSSVKDLTGLKFGRLLVLEKTDLRASETVIWRCICICGEEKLVSSGHLLSGHTKSCGCFMRDRARESNIKHNMCYTDEYKIYQGMIKRCSNLSDTRYGGRGIKVCDRWIDSFENFYLDMGPRPSKLHSIDRKDNNGNYDPDNCKWSTSEEQSNNKRNNIYVNYNNEILTISQLAKKYNKKESKIRKRLRLNWDIQKIMDTN